MLASMKYFWQTRQPKKELDQLIMSILCRNEVDIIEANIKTHASLGVDGFVVMDNGSTDGTREKLAELAQQYNVHIIDQASQTYQQARWMKQLALYARDKMHARWVISNDADEFWIPENGNLKSYLLAKDSVVTVKRSNMLLTQEALTDGYHFSHSDHRVLYPICYDREVQKNDDQISMLLVPISPKVIVNPSGLIKLSGGNHRAKHVGKVFSERNELGIHVYHYPIRSLPQFEANIKHRAELLKLPNAKMGDHYRRWVRIYQSGALHQEFERFVLSPEQLATFVEYRVAVKDNKPHKAILKALE